MRRLKRTFDNLTVTLLRPIWIAGSGQKKPSPFMEGIGKAILLGAAGYALYNVYTCIQHGMIYRFARRPRGSSDWITYADDPASFLLWTGIYSVPILIAALVVAGHIYRQKEAKRATLRHFSEGLGPAPIRRSVGDR